MPRRSAAILLFRADRALDPDLFLVHPGGPFFARKDEGAWSLPKGEIDDPDEDPYGVAVREFEEETGQPLERCARAGAAAEPIPLGEIKQRGGKVVTAWAVEGDWPEGAELRSNTFEIEWPPRSGRRQTFPEVDRAEFFPLDEARRKINPAQAEFFDRLLERLRGDAAR